MRISEKKIGKIIDKDAQHFIAYDDNDEIRTLTNIKLNLMKRNGIKEIWFSTYISSDSIDFFKHNREAHIYFFHKSFFKGVDLTGTIDILETLKSKELILKKDNGSYTQGKEEFAFYCVIKFTTIKGRYFTTSKSKYFNINET